MFTPINDRLEKFENVVSNEYIKLNETYLDDGQENLKLDLLYANYSGEETKDINQEHWSNKTLSQCTDTCSKLNNCIGFSRDMVGDEENAICYPRTSIDKCHSYRKGSFPQRQHALAYNTYIKATTPNALTQCLGDLKITLDRIIYIKSYAYPDRFIGLNTNNEIGLVQRNESGIDFGKAAQFKIIAGKDGSGTVSFKHIASNKYLYRDNGGNNGGDNGNMIIGKTLNDTTTSTDDKQRASFTIEDGMSNNIIIKCLSLHLENTDRYIGIYPKNNKYLNVQAISELNIANTSKQTKKSIKQMKMITFEIVDNIISSTVIDSRKYISDAMKPMRTYPATPNRQLATSNSVTPNMRTYSNDNIQNFADINNSSGDLGSSTRSNTTPTAHLDNSMDDYNYYKLMSGKTEQKELRNYIQDKYLDNPISNPQLKIQSDLVNQLNLNQMNATVGDATKKAQEKYKNLKAMNTHIENSISNGNIDVVSTSNNLTSNLDKMKIQDLSKDYFFLKNLSS